MPSTTTSRLEGLTTSVAVKAPCRLKTTANHSLTGLAEIDGVTPAERDRILVAANSDASENGIWLAQPDAWIRATDFDGSYDVVCGTTVFVHSGTTNAGTFWRVTTPDPIVIGEIGIAWANAPIAVAGSAADVGLFTAIGAVSIPAGIDAVRTSGYSETGRGASTYVSDAQATAGLASAHPQLCKQSADGRYWRALLEPDGGLNVDVAGAAGDGIANDFAAITATRNYVKAVGGGIVSFAKGKTYRTGSMILAGRDMTWNFNGASLACSAQIPVFGSSYDPVANKVAHITADILGPTDQITVDSVAGLAVGDYILVRAGHNPWDNNEPLWATTCRVVSIAALTLTLDVTIPRCIYLNQAYNYVTQAGGNIAVPVVTATGANRSVYKLPGDGINVTINDPHFIGDTAPTQSVEGVFWFQGGRDITINRPVGNFTGATNLEAGTGLVGLVQFCRNIVINEPKLYYNKNGRNQASLGRMFNFSNCINGVIRNPIARGLQSCFCFIESFCENFLIDSPVVEMANPTILQGVFFVVQGSACRIVSPTIVPVNGHAQDWKLHDSGGTDHDCEVTGVVKIRGILPRGITVNDDIAIDYDNHSAASFTGSIAGTTLTTSSLVGTITLGATLFGSGVANNTRITANLGGGSYAVSESQNLASTAMRTREFAYVDFRAPESVPILVSLAANMYETYSFGGVHFQPQFIASSGVNLADITGIYMGFDDSNGANWMTYFTAGKVSSDDLGSGISTFGTYYGGLKRLSGVGFALVSHSAAEPVAGSFIGVKVKVARVVRTSLLISPATVVNQMAMSDVHMAQILIGEKRLHGAASFAPGLIAAGAQATVGDITVVDARAGDIVTVSAPTTTGGLHLWGEFIGNNTVRVFARNGTSGGITPPAGIYRASVKEH